MRAQAAKGRKGKGRQGQVSKAEDVKPYRDGWTSTEFGKKETYTEEYFWTYVQGQLINVLYCVFVLPVVHNA